MGKPIGMTIIKGQTIDNHFLTKEGRKLLAWVANQPVQDDPTKPFLAPWCEKRNNYIREGIKKFQDTGEPPKSALFVEPTPPTAQITGYSEGGSPTKTEKLILQKLDTILDLLSKDSPGWDEIPE